MVAITYSARKQGDEMLGFARDMGIDLVHSSSLSKAKLMKLREYLEEKIPEGYVIETIAISSMAIDQYATNNSDIDQRFNLRLRKISLETSV